MRTSKSDQAGDAKAKPPANKAPSSPNKAVQRPGKIESAKAAAEAAAKEKAATAELAIADDRHPVTIAFEQYIRSGSVTDAEMDRWKDELTQAVAEGARKFVGFNNVNAMKKSLDINLGLLSLGLMLKVEGRIDIKGWGECVGKYSIKDFLKEALVNLKSLAYTDTYLFGEMVESPARDLVLAIATARDRSRRHVWNGWREFLRERASRRHQQNTDKLARHLIKNVVGSEPESWIKRVNRKHSEFGGSATAEETINTIILRHCLLKPRERFPEDVYVNMEFLRKIRADYDAAEQSWLDRMRIRYDELLESMPYELHEPLNGWFENHFKDGPPKLGKEKKKKKREDDDDENEEIQEMAGVSGIYLNQIFM